jgi:hypothetical protein
VVFGGRDINVESSLTAVFGKDRKTLTSWPRTIYLVSGTIVFISFIALLKFHIAELIVNDQDCNCTKSCLTAREPPHLLTLLRLKYHNGAIWHKIIIRDHPVYLCLPCSPLRSLRPLRFHSCLIKTDADVCSRTTFARLRWNILAIAFPPKAPITSME